VRVVADTALLIAIGFVGGGLAHVAGVPMPFLTGSLAAVAGFVIWADLRSGRSYSFPQPLRRVCVGVIGALIGATFERSLLAGVQDLWISLLAMVPFVVLVHQAVFRFYFHVGKFDRATATFAAMPGGLIEAVAIGEQAGSDVRSLPLQHFARIVLVVVIVPLLFLMWSGEQVGSASGEQMEARATGPVDIAIILAIAAVGVWVGPKLRLPAAHLTAPLILSAVAHASGATDATGPPWLLYLAQVVVGGGLGAMFAGTRVSHLVRAFSLAAVAVALVLAIGMVFALVLNRLSGLPVDALFISFAPGGVTEMGLIALSLGISPVFVAIHHLVRILLTVGYAGLLARPFRR